MPENNFSPISIKDLYGYENKASKWLIDKLIPENGVAILSGESGSYKTWLLLHIAASVAGGTPVFDTFPVQQGKVLMIDEENRHSLLVERLKLLGIQEDLPIQFVVKTGFDLNAGGNYINDFYNFVDKNKIKLVTFDSLVRIHGKDENNAKEMAELFRSFTTLQNLGVSVIITHHHRKEQNKQSQRMSQMLRGSSDIRAGLDSHLAVVRNGDKEVQIVQTKNRDSEEFPAFALKIEEEDSKIKFRFNGEVVIGKKSKAKQRIMQLFEKDKTLEADRENVVSWLQDDVGVSKAGEALAELVNEKKLKERVAEHGKKFYTLVI